MKTKGASLPVLGNPVACRRIVDPDDVDQIRRLDCRSYDRCLDLAVEEKWRGFHCRECRGYEAPTPDEQKSDMIAALTLLAETQLLTALSHEPLFVDETEDNEADEDDEDDPETEGRAPGMTPDRALALN